ncbi:MULTISPECIES: LamG-like jellyroll fold domain-containing protein [unclassified Kitasatospora]|uniref:LamG-like jellyroll fold domain-containing protein n=1 Tax=unclassified Kitasatospora TaxID=2633591 RepID=UPI002473E57D|nr:LamG-like jellyroll fold domain-containing protein [Kitasatospora sp. MAP12-44]
MTALAEGGWRDVIIVKTAAAAANPALKTLHFPISTTGLTAASDSAGNVTFKDASGAVRLHAPTPLQWDSTLPAPAAAGVANPSGARSLFTARAAKADASASAVDTGASTADAPGDNANVATIAAVATSSSIDLTPDQNTLGKGTGPWYLDPTISADSASQASVQVQENYPDTKNYNALSTLGTGYCGYSDCTGYGRYRAYYQIGINPAIYTTPGGAPKPPTIYSATLATQVTDASSPTTPTPMGLYWTGPIDGNTTWNNQPCSAGSTMGGCNKIGDNPITGTGPLNYDVTSQMQQAAQGHWANWTIGLAPDDENNKLYRHHFANNPDITTNYDITPSIWAPRTTPTPGNASSSTSNACPTNGTTDGTNVAWVGSNQNITLTVNNWSPAGMNLHTIFRMWDDKGWSWSGDSGWAGSYNNNGVSVNVGSLTDGRTYDWRADAYDADPPSGGLGSTDSTDCYFHVDKTPPVVAISSTQFPPSGTPNPNPTVFAGQSGTFTLTGNDPAPAGGAASGVACYRVSNDPTPVTGWKCSDGAAAGIVPAARPTFTYTPGNWGTNLLYAQAQDNAGNYSQPAAYSFYAPWNPKSSAVFGDVTGDGKPDIVLPDAAGNLKLIGTTTDPINALSARATLSPNGKSWSGVQISHRGSLTPGISVDDLIAHLPGGPDVYQFLNTGNGNFTAPTVVGPPPNSCQDATGALLSGGCPSALADWSAATQVIAIGTPEGENNTPTSITRTSLVAVINKQLWLFHSAPKTDLSDYFDGTARQLSSADWSNYDLINPGPANGGNQPTLWARNRTDGTIHAYRITGGATPNYSDLADPAANGVTIPGINLSAAAYPTVGSSGDLNGDGIPDLWATSPTNQLTIWTGTADATGKVTGFNNPTNPTNLVKLPTPVGRWALTGADATGTKTADSLGQDSTSTLGTHPGALTNVTFAADNPTGAAPTTVASFTGNGEIDATNSTLDTSSSFSIDVWVKPSALGGVVASSDGTNASGFILWPEASDSTWRFALSTADDNTWPYDQTTDAMNSNAHVQLNTWTHLTASFNADSHQTSLYVNGVLAASGHHTTNSGIKGPIVMGRYKYQGKPTPGPNYSGSMSNLAVYPTATNPSTPAANRILSAQLGNKCIDNNSAVSNPGNVVQLWDCVAGAPSEQWTVNPNGTVNTVGGCLDNTNNVLTDGNLVQWNTCTGGASEQWIPRADGSLYNPASGRCLDDPFGNIANGTRLQIFDCNGGLNQRWIIAPAN